MATKNKSFTMPAAQSFISTPALELDQGDPVKVEEPKKTEKAKKEEAKKTAKERNAEEALERLKEYPAPEGYDVPLGYMLVRERRVSRINLLIEPSLKDKLKRTAIRRGISMNELIVRLIEENL